jgi:hypothetical protein
MMSVEEEIVTGRKEWNLDRKSAREKYRIAVIWKRCGGRPQKIEGRVSLKISGIS